MKKIIILASGNGSNFEILAQKIVENKLQNCKIEMLFSNKKNAFVLQRAKKFNIETVSFEVKDFKNKDEYNKELLKLLLKYNVDYIVCAGYMLMIPSFIIDYFPNKIINIHPSYLPDLKGMNAIKKAYESDRKYTGISIHYIVEKMDSGKILFQKKINIDRKKSYKEFEDKIHQEEHKYFYKTINNLINK